MNITDEYIKKLPNTESLVKDLEERLIKMYGVLISSNDLWKILCFKTPYAYRQARYRKLLSITEFEMHGRKGRFALASEVAVYIAKQRLEAENNLTKEKE